jgi:DNA invertase Pin-like site-specific DNA recombinase
MPEQHDPPAQQRCTSDQLLEVQMNVEVPTIVGYDRINCVPQCQDWREICRQEFRQRAQAAGVPVPEIVYLDHASGNAPFRERPEAARLLREVRPGDRVISKLDRLGRNSCDVLATVEAFIEAGIDLALLDIGPEPVTRASTSLVLLRAVAAFEAELSEAVKDAAAR